MKAGVAQYCLRRYSTARRIRIDAQAEAKRQRSGGAGEKAVLHRIDPVRQHLEVERGEWPARIEVRHPGWDEERKAIVLDDSVQELCGLTAVVFADNAEECRAPLALKMMIEGTEYTATKRADGSGVYAFPPCAVNTSPDVYLNLLKLYVHEERDTDSPPCETHVTVHRTEGTPSSVAVLSMPGVILSAAKPFFEVSLVMKNKLGERITFRAERVRFELDRVNTGITLNANVISQVGAASGRCKVTVSEREDQDGLMNTVKSGVYAVVECVVEPSSMGEQGQASRFKLESAEFPLEYAPKLQVQKDAGRCEQRRKDKEAIRSEQQGLDEREKRFIQQRDQATTNFEQCKRRLAEGQNEEALKNRLSNISNAIRTSQATQLSKGNLFKHHSNPLKIFLQLEREGKLPRNLQSEILGVVGNLGYVEERDPHMRRLFSEGIAALGGPNMQALVVRSERGVDLLESLRQSTPQLKGIRSLVLPRNVSHPSRLWSLPPAPRGAHFAVNKIRVERLESDVQQRMGELFGAPWAERLCEHVWFSAAVLGDALIFERESDMEAYKLAHGRTHRMAAPRGRGEAGGEWSWRIVPKGQVSVIGEAATRFVDVRYEIDGHETDAYRSHVQLRIQIQAQLDERRRLKEEVETARLVAHEASVPPEDFPQQRLDLKRREELMDEEEESHVPPSSSREKRRAPPASAPSDTPRPPPRRQRLADDSPGPAASSSRNLGDLGDLGNLGNLGDLGNLGNLEL